MMPTMTILAELTPLAAVTAAGISSVYVFRNGRRTDTANWHSKTSDRKFEAMEAFLAVVEEMEKKARTFKHPAAAYEEFETAHRRLRLTGAPDGVAKASNLVVEAVGDVQETWAKVWLGADAFAELHRMGVAHENEDEWTSESWALDKVTRLHQEQKKAFENGGPEPDTAAARKALEHRDEDFVPMSHERIDALLVSEAERRRLRKEHRNAVDALQKTADEFVNSVNTWMNSSPDRRGR